MGCWIVSDKDKASKDATILFTYEKNDTGKKRSATIVVKSPDGKITKECRVEQDFRLVTVYWNDEQSGTFQKDCLANEVSTVVRYSIPAGVYSSYESKDAANLMAKQALNEKGQAYANEHAECIKNLYGNTERRCERMPECPVGYKPQGTVTYIVPAGKYTGETQLEADQKAINDIHDNCQAYANANGTCVEVDKFTGTCSKNFTLRRTNCSEGGVPKDLTFAVSIEKRGNSLYLVAPGKEELIVGVDAAAIISTINQDDANQKACDVLESKAQEFAKIYVNEKGVCEYTGKYSKTFTAECQAGETPATLKVDESMVTGGPFKSEISKEDADNKAKTAVEAQGQAMVNALPNACTSNAGPWYGSATVRVCKSDCGACEDAGCSEIQFPSPSFSAIPQELYKSDVSQDDANSKAAALFTTTNSTQITVSGQPMTVGAYIQSVYNKNSACTPKLTNPEWVQEGADFCENGKSYQNFKQNNQCCVNPAFGTIEKRLGGNAVCRFSATGAATKTLTRTETCGVCKKPQSASVTLKLSNDGQNAVFVVGGVEYPSGFSVADITYVSDISQEDANQKAKEKVEALLSMSNDKTASFVNKNVGCDPQQTSPTQSAPVYSCDGCTYVSTITYSSYCDEHGIEQPSKTEVSIVESNSSHCDTGYSGNSSYMCKGCKYYEVKKKNCSGLTSEEYIPQLNWKCGEDEQLNEYKCEGCDRYVKERNSCDHSMEHWSLETRDHVDCLQYDRSHNKDRFICDEEGRVYYEVYNICWKQYTGEKGDLLYNTCEGRDVLCKGTTCNGTSIAGNMIECCVDHCGVKRYRRDKQIQCSVKNYTSEYRCQGPGDKSYIQTSGMNYMNTSFFDIEVKVNVSAGYDEYCNQHQASIAWESVSGQHCCYCAAVFAACPQGYRPKGNCISVGSSCVQNKNISPAQQKALALAEAGKLITQSHEFFNSCCEVDLKNLTIELTIGENECIQGSTPKWLPDTKVYVKRGGTVVKTVNIPNDFGWVGTFYVSGLEAGQYIVEFDAYFLFQGMPRNHKESASVNVLNKENSLNLSVNLSC